MNFWTSEHLRNGNAHALVDEVYQSLSYAELDQRVAQASGWLRQRGARQFGILFMSNTAASLVAYLACLRAGHVPLLLPVNLATHLTDSLIRLYQPDWVMGAYAQVERCARGDFLPGSGVHFVAQQARDAPQLRLAPELAVLLSTSGSTGSPRLVRLSYSALQANATSIAEFLSLGRTERALTVLPPYYSYGLSVINSHLAARACLVLRNVSVLSPDFSKVMREQAITSISGVPYTYQMLHRTGFRSNTFPSLRTITQAGGRLDDRLARSFAELARDRGWKFFVMYGQTEATARISYIPSDSLLNKLGSIGVAIPRGELSIDPANDEIVYRGPNVMLGYAQDRNDLALGDQMRGVLRTGDLGRRDEDGFFYVTGRIKRFIKLAGIRIGLDEVEQLLQREIGVPVALGGCDDRLVVWIESDNTSTLEATQRALADNYGIHHSLCRISNVESLPLLPTGKIDYNALMVNE